MLGQLRVGAGHQHSQIGDMGQRVPHLLARSPPTRRRRVRPGCPAPRSPSPSPGSLNSWAPPLLAGEHRPQVAALLLVGAVGEDRRGRSGPTRTSRGPLAGPPAARNRRSTTSLEPAGQAEPTEARRMVHPGQTGVRTGGPGTRCDSRWRGSWSARSASTASSAMRACSAVPGPCIGGCHGWFSGGRCGRGSVGFMLEPSTLWPDWSASGRGAAGRRRCGRRRRCCRGSARGWSAPMLMPSLSRSPPLMV